MAFFSSVLWAAWTSKRLTNNSGHSYFPAIAARGANVYVAWYDDTPGNEEIYFRRSVDGGASWQSAERITNNEGESFEPAIAASDLNVFLVWWDRSPGNSEIFFRKSEDGGATWKPAKRITYNVGESENPAIAVNHANVYVIWCDKTPGNYEIYFRKSADGGSTWQAARRLTSGIGASLYPAIAVNGTNVYVVWSEYAVDNWEIYFRKSADGGATWQSAKRLTTNAGDSRIPDIAVSEANIYVTWYDNTPIDNEIYFRKSADGGANWQAPRTLTNNAWDSNLSAIAVNGPHVFVIWSDYTPGNWEIFFKKSTDSGSTWQAAQRLTNNLGCSYAPDIATNGTNVYVTYYDSTPGNEEIYVKYSPL